MGEVTRCASFLSALFAVWALFLAVLAVALEGPPSVFPADFAEPVRPPWPPDGPEAEPPFRSVRGEMGGRPSAAWDENRAPYVLRERLRYRMLDAWLSGREPSPEDFERYRRMMEIGDPGWETWYFGVSRK